jgi:hypothetical protein
MSARALGAWTLDPAATRREEAEGHPTAIQFREDLWREYRIEALRAGCSSSQATEYATALSPDLGLGLGKFEVAPVGRAWFYHSRNGAVNRTISSGLIPLARWQERGNTRRTTAAIASAFARWARPWNIGEKG